MENKANFGIELDTILENTEIEPIEKKSNMQKNRIAIERLNGGFISDATGERKIYQDTDEIIEAIGMEKLLHDLKFDQYKLILDLVPQSEYDDYIDLVKQHQKENETLTLAEAKEQGIIQTEKFNPNKSIVEESNKEIKVTKENCYSITRLKAIDWKSFDEQLSLNNVEKAEICGISATSMYPMWNNALKGTAKFNFAQTRITMTILAKFYEKNLGIRTSTKEQNEFLKQSLLADIRELEIMCDSKFVKSSDIVKLIARMRKPLI